MRTIRELRRASVMLGRPGLPGTGVTSGQLADITGKANRAETRQYDSRSWPTLNDAIDAVHALGGGELFVAEPPPAGADIVLKDTVYLTGRGIGATVLDVNTITGSGSLEALPALSSHVAKHARTVTFAAAPDLAPGDVFVLYNSADGSFNTARTVYRAGEFCRVAAVSGSTVTLTAPTYDAYNAGSTVTAHKLVPIRTGVSGMTIRGVTGVPVIRVDLGTDLVFRDLDVSGSDTSHLTLSRCYNVDISRVKAFDASPVSTPDATNYGIVLANCQRVRVSDVDLETRRHGLTTGGDNSIGCVPVRDVRISDSTISGFSDAQGVCGLNLHGNAEDIHILNCALPAGFNPGGTGVTVRGCTIGQAAWGGAIYSAELLGADLAFEHNTIHVSRNWPSSLGLINITLGAAASRGRGVLRFAHNTIDCGPYGGDGAAHYVTRIIVAHADVPGDNLCVIDNNIVRTAQTVGPEHQAFQIEAPGGSPGFTDVYVTDTTGLSSRSIAPAPFLRFEGRGPGEPTFAAAPGSRYLRTDGGAGSTLYIKETAGSSGTWRAV